MRTPAGIERLYVDFDSFFATAEQHLRPDLRGRPVGVTPVDSEHTGLIAASREAKRLGIKRGAWVREARRACPGIVLVPARHDAYVRLHREIVKAIDRVAPILAVRSIDEMVCALSPGDQARPEALGRAVKAAIACDVGPLLRLSLTDIPGIARGNGARLNRAGVADVAGF